MFNFTEKREDEKNTAIVSGFSNSINMQYIYEVQDHFITNPKSAKLLVKLHSNYNDEAVKKEILKISRQEFSIRKVKENELDDYMEAFETFMWKYYLIDPLLDDENITDIALYDKDTTTTLDIEGKRKDTGIKFRDEKDYDRFIRGIALKNGVQLSDGGALQKFMDEGSHEKYKLRIDIFTEYVTGHGKKYMHIRKIPKVKFQTEDLVARGAATLQEMKYCIEQINGKKGFLIVGANNSAKTTFLNGFLDKFNPDKKIMVMQENDGELFSDPEHGGRKDILFVKTVLPNAEGGFTYDYEQFIEQAQISDINTIVYGEIKSSRAAAKFFNAASKGLQCVATLHAPSAVDGIDSLVDYIHQGTGYSMEECYKMLRCLGTIIYMENKKLTSIISVNGWNEDKKTLNIEAVKFA